MASAQTARALLPGISELLEKQRYKEALDQIKKKLKKSQEPSIFALRAQVLLEYGDIPACTQQCKELLNKKPPLKDTVTVSGLYAVLAALVEDPRSDIKAAELTKVWQDALAQQPSAALKAEHAIDWAGEAVHLGLWGQVAQAAGAAQRHLLPTDRRRRQFFFWQQVGNWLDSTQPGSDSRMSIMVVRSLEMALKNKPQEEPKPDAVAGNWISNKAEFALLKEVFSGSHSSQKLLALLDERSPQPQAESLALDSWGVAEARLSALGDVSGEHEPTEFASKSWALAKDVILSSQKEGVQWKADKFHYWEYLISSLARMNFPASESSETLQLLDTGPPTRTKTLARILYWRTRMNVLSDLEDATNLLDSLKTHLTLNMKNPLCADDTLNRANGTSIFKGNELQERCSTIAAALRPATDVADATIFPWLYAETNALKYEHAAILAGATAGEKHKKLQDLASRGIKVYQISRATATLVPKTARHPGDEAALVAAKALLDVGTGTQSQWPLLQAVTLLCHVVSNAESNFDARSLLLSPLQSLGMFSLAESHYKRLDVKSILNENSAPRLFTRISTFAPLKNRTRDVTDSMRTVLQWYSNAVSTTSDYQEKALDNQNYQQSIHMEQFKQRLRNSATRQMIRLECRRVARLAQTAFDESGLRFDTHAPRDDAIDDRSFAANDADKIPSGPRPTKIWLQAMSLIDAGFDLVRIPFEQSTKPSADTSPHRLDDAAVAAALTAAELASYRLLSLLSDTSMKTSTATISPDEIASSLSQISKERCANLTRLRSVLESAKSQPFSGWEVPHEAYHFLDVERALAKFATSVSSYADEKLKKADKEARTALTAATKSLTSEVTNDGQDSARQIIRNAALEAVQKIEKLESDGDLFDGVFGDAASGDVGTKLLELMGESTARRTLGGMASSARDGLDMILQVPRI